MVRADRVSMSVQTRRRVLGLRQTLEQPLPQVSAAACIDSGWDEFIPGRGNIAG